MRSTSLSCFLRPNDSSFFHIDLLASAGAAAAGSSDVSSFCLRPRETSFFHIDCFGSADAAGGATVSSFGLRPKESSFFHIDCFGSAPVTGGAGCGATGSATASGCTSPSGWPFLRPIEISFFQNESLIA